MASRDFIVSSTSYTRSDIDYDAGEDKRARRKARQQLPSEVFRFLQFQQLQLEVRHVLPWSSCARELIRPSGRRRPFSGSLAAAEAAAWRIRAATLLSIADATQADVNVLDEYFGLKELAILRPSWPGLNTGRDFLRSSTRTLPLPSPGSRPGRNRRSSRHSGRRELLPELAYEVGQAIGHPM
jgi:hypothetical protein